MIIIKNNKFAESESEYIESLFAPGGTCKGYAKRYKKQIVLQDHNKVKVGVITCHGVIAKATKVDNGWWYSYGDIDLIGNLSIVEHDEILQGLSVRNDNGVYLFKNT